MRFAPSGETMTDPGNGSSRGARCSAEAMDLTEVVAELSFQTPVLQADLATMEHSCAHCFEIYRVQLVALILSRDRKRAVLLFRAPDAESVRIACRHAPLFASAMSIAAMTIDRVWQCCRPMIDRNGLQDAECFVDSLSLQPTTHGE